jgi:hypothetical protein
MKAWHSFAMKLAVLLGAGSIASLQAWVKQRRAICQDRILGQK